MWVLVLITMIGQKFDGAKAFDVFEDRKPCEKAFNGVCLHQFHHMWRDEPMITNSNNFAITKKATKVLKLFTSNGYE